MTRRIAFRVDVAVVNFGLLSAGAAAARRAGE
jgi:hypothetical protein